MFVLCVIVCSVLAVLAFGMGAAQLNKVPQAIAVMDHVGAKRLAPLSGWLLIAAAVGLVVGLFWAPIGIAAAAGLVLYFLIAALMHVRVKDPIGQILNPLVPAAISAQPSTSASQPRRTFGGFGDRRCHIQLSGHVGNAWSNRACSSGVAGPLKPQ
jgi:hypothetical protein